MARNPFNFTYAVNHWDKFIVCLENRRLEVDNNLAENKVRPAKLGARNWMFVGSLEAGANNALLYTLMANCRIQGLDPEMYLLGNRFCPPRTAPAQRGDRSRGVRGYDGGSRARRRSDRRRGGGLDEGATGDLRT